MGIFNNVNDAMGQVGGLLNSPAMTSVNRLQDAATSLNMTVNLDQNVLEAGFPGYGNQFYQQLQEVQNLSDAFDECGNYAQDAIQASTEDYIKNTGIQEAGRDLANTLGQYSDEVDCIAGFATLFDSKGILDDVLGLGDLPQIQSRIQQIVLDITDPSKLANMITNLDAVQGLLEPFNDFCTGMKDAFNQLVAKDLAALNAILNKLAQWAAFANLATGDPCALVNNNQMFNSVTDPVMDDIIDLYEGVIGGGDLGDIVGDIFSPDTPTALVGGNQLVPQYKQASGTVIPFETYFSSLGTSVSGNQTSIDIVGATVVPLEWDPIANSWVEVEGEVSTDGVTGLDSISLGFESVIEQITEVFSGVAEAVAAGMGNPDNAFNPVLDNFKKVKETIEFKALMEHKDGIKQFKVGSCSGGDTLSNMSEEECLNNNGIWHDSSYTTSSSEVSGLSKVSGYDSVTEIKTGTSSSVVKYQPAEKQEPTSFGSGADAPRVKTKILGKVKAIAEQGSIPTAVGKDVESPGTSAKASSPEINKERMYNIPTQFDKHVSGAKVQSPGTTSSFESSITRFDKNIDVINAARESGDYSKITVCRCTGNVNYADKSSCESNGGTWKCQIGTTDAGLVAQQVITSNMIRANKNIELSSVLPTKKAFVGIT